MGYRLVEMVLNSGVTDPTEAAVLIALAHHADKFCSCFPSIARICQLSRYKERAVQQAIKRLSARGVISVKTGGGRGGASFYTIHPAALNPAADAPFSSDKPRAKCGDTDPKTPQQMRETPHLMRENPAADAPEPVIEPVKNQLGCARGHQAAISDRAVAMRAVIVDALGIDATALTVRGTPAVLGLKAEEIEASLSVWDQHKLTDDQIAAAIRSTVARERGKQAGWLPRGVRYFDHGIADHAKRRGQAVSTTASDSSETRRAERRKQWASF